MCISLLSGMFFIVTFCMFSESNLDRMLISLFCLFVLYGR
jgi:hypothetical protein